MLGPNTAPLKHFTTHPNYLKSNSTSHNWAFSAFAELFDNSVDAGASEIHISTASENTKLVVTDNGSGMDITAFDRMLSLGYCDKDDNKIGKYGNGFKSGSMRLGKDTVVFTKHENSCSVGFLSQTFLEKINANEVLVPMCTWDNEGKFVGDEKQAHKSLNIITTYSPWESDDEIMNEFKKIPKTGTTIYIFNLSTVADGQTELEFSRTDIKLRERRDDPKLNATERDPPLWYSLKAYLEVLYLVPRTQFYLQGYRVPTKIVSRTLYLTKTSPIKIAGYPETKVTYGFNPNPKVRNINYGVFLYHRNRLIEPLLKVGSMTAPNSVGRGVLGAAEIPFLTPTHNKQGFMQNNLYIRVKRNLAAAFNAYWRSCVPHGGIGAFWNSIPVGTADDPYVQCQTCFKWRPLPKGSPLITPSLNDAPWLCSMSTVEKIDCTTTENTDLVHTSRKIKRREEKKTKKRKRSGSKKEDEGGASWVGLRAKAYLELPEGAKWQYGVIDDYFEETDEYKILYDNGTFAFAGKSTFQLADKSEQDGNSTESDDESSSSEPYSEDEGKKGDKKKKGKRDRKNKKKKRKISKEDSSIKTENGEVVENAIVFDLNEESHENQTTVVRQKHLNSTFKNLEMFYQKVKEIASEGDVPLQKFDELKLHKLGKELRNDLNYVLAPFEGVSDE